mmetsp:Transcript_2984/g.5527  ORF Transcript_2984/g.5527 Transcript_2984/m.5527 type:complete len:251 (-) Transcript_2984:255-1007(-)
MSPVALIRWVVFFLYFCGIAHASSAQSRSFLPKPFTVVLTGGPCGGKTTSLPELKKHLEDLGYKVYTVPESATLLQVGGVERLALCQDEDYIAFQTSILDVQMNLEENFRRMADVCQRRSVLLLDRGALDPKGYISRSLWQQVLHRCNLSEEDLIKRYDLVVHLVSTANGAEEYYGSHTNHIRVESLEDSRKQDLKELQSWSAHPRRVIIDNSTGWGAKMERAAQAIKENLEVLEVEMMADEFSSGAEDY